MSTEFSNPPTRAYTRYVLTLIFMVSVFNTCDRTILSVMVEEIRSDLLLDDRQMGFIMGLAFAVTYFVAGIPLARIADNWSRPKMVSVAVFSWSVMTALGGMTQNFIQMALTRVGVGFGEAGASPACQAMISDYVAPERRARAMALLTIGAICGLALGVVYGGWASAQWSWRIALISVGIPGAILSLVFLFTVRDYRTAPEERNADNLFGQIKSLLAIRPFALLTLSACLVSVPATGRAMWEPTFLRRVYEMSSTEAGVWYFITGAVPTAMGALLLGYLTDRLAQRDPRWYAWLPAVAGLMMVPLALMFYISDPAPMLFGIMPRAFLWSIAASMLAAAWTPATMALSAALVPGSSRAVAAAIWSMLASLIGTGLGPLLVGDMNARLETTYGNESVRYSLMLISLAPIIASLTYVLTARAMGPAFGKPTHTLTTKETHHDR